MSKVIYGAVDIGSNAVRAMAGYVKEKDGQLKVKKKMRKRAPLRIGAEIIRNGNLSESSLNRLSEVLKAYKKEFREVGVKDLRVCGTESLRLASNADQIIDRIKGEAGLTVQVLSGQEEAEVVFSHRIEPLAQREDVLYADVGGGSTDLVYQNKGGDRILTSISIGTHRILAGKDTEESWNDLEGFLNEAFHEGGVTYFYGSGGNIRKLRKMSGKKAAEPLSLEELQNFHSEMAPLSPEERMAKLGLKADRSDVIVPAIDIFLFIMKVVQQDKVYAPKTTLNEGLILEQHFNNEPEG